MRIIIIFISTFIICCTFAVTAQTKRITFKVPLLYPEGTVYDAANNCFYVSSATTAVIGKVTPDGNYAVLFNDTSLKSTFGMKIDSAAKVLWVCAGDPNYSKYKDSATTFKKMIRLVGIDLKTGKQKANVDLSNLYNGKHFANDITLDNSGNKYITDSYSPVIYKVDAQNNATVLVQNDLFKSIDIGLNGIVWHPDGYLLTVNNSDGTILKVDLKNPSNVTVVKAPQFFIGADGLLLDKQNNLYLVQNKSVNKAFVLSSSDAWQTAQVVASTGGTDRFQNPSTCTFNNSDLYLLNSKLNELSDPTAKPSIEFSLQLAVFKK